MRIITSWLKVNRALGAVIGITALFCALRARPREMSLHIYSISLTAPVAICRTLTSVSAYEKKTQPPICFL
jgi:hypothetical protein